MTQHKVSDADAIKVLAWMDVTCEEAAKRFRADGRSMANAKFRRIFREQRDGRPYEPIRLEEEPKPKATGVVQAPDELRKKMNSRRYILTCAQNNTHIHEGFWTNLLKYVDSIGATLMVGKITYNKAAWVRRGGVKKSGTDDIDTEDLAEWYDDRLEPYFVNEQVKIAPNLLWCGELDISPTASDPLSGFDSYTGPNSAVIPHTKVRLKSLPTMKHEPAKFMFTTGVVTQRNYIERKIGQIASFHHVYGAVVVEVDDDGKWFARHINATDDGMFVDISDVAAQGGVAVLGDIHIEKADAAALNGAFQMLAVTRPKDIIVHDIIDFTERNHHNIKDPHFIAERFYAGNIPVEKCFSDAAQFLKTVRIMAPQATIHVVRSNHDEAFEKWVKDGSGFIDPVNARFWHEANAAKLLALENGDKKFDLFKWAIGRFLAPDPQISLLEMDDSLVINGIQYAIHGHVGANGGRASPKTFAGSGRKVSDAHTHTASIKDGTVTAPVLGKLDMGYNRGLSSWSQGSSYTYPNGKRAVIIQHGVRWRGKEL